jgi:small conductance mechanosensitive channel
LVAWLDSNGWQKLGKLLAVVATCAIILWALKLVSRAVARTLASGMGHENAEAQRRAKTLGAVIGNFARVLVISFFILETLQELNVNVGPLVAGVGIVGAAIGFGAQNLVKDVIGGFFLLVENQYGVGDIISVGDKHIGTVERMTFRVTMLRDTEGRAHYIPNGAISEVVVLSKHFAKALVDVEVSHDEDLDRTMAVIREVGQELAHALETVLEPTEVLGVEAMTPASCTIRTLTKCAPGQQWAVARELRRRVQVRFKLEGFGRPIPQRMIINR